MKATFLLTAEVAGPPVSRLALVVPLGVAHLLVAQVAGDVVLASLGIDLVTQTAQGGK